MIKIPGKTRTFKIYAKKKDLLLDQRIEIPWCRSRQQQEGNSSSPSSPAVSGGAGRENMPDYLHSHQAANLLRWFSILWPCRTHGLRRLPLLWSLLNSSCCFSPGPAENNKFPRREARLVPPRDGSLPFLSSTRDLFSFEHRQAEVLIHCVFTAWHFMC